MPEKIEKSSRKTAEKPKGLTPEIAKGSFLEFKLFP